MSLRSKAKVPGLAAPWQITPQISGARGDPFDALPIAMPFRSMDVLEFCRVLVYDIIRSFTH